MDELMNRQGIKVLLLENIDPVAANIFADAGYSKVDILGHALSEDALMHALMGVHVLGIRSRTRLSARVLQAAEDLVVVGCFCAGTNQVDLIAAAQLGIPVFNAPFENTRSVAELVLAEAILLLRDIPAKNTAAHKGVWLKAASKSFEIRGKVLGIIGYGNVGAQLSILAEALGMAVLFYDIDVKRPEGNAQPAPTLDYLLSNSDIVSLHVPETPATHRMITSREMSLMTPGSILINASRGTVIVIDDLADALATGHLGGAAIDVFPEEPRNNSELFESPLRQFDNVLLTPHIGGSTREAQRHIAVRVAGALTRYIETGAFGGAVNISESAASFDIATIDTSHGFARLDSPGDAMMLPRAQKLSVARRPSSALQGMAEWRSAHFGKLPLYVGS